MNKNFSIDQAVGLECGDCYFDLHNCYDFIGFSFDVARKVFKLKFEQTADSSRKLLIEIEDVSSLELSDNCLINISKNLSEIGYKPASDRDHDWLVDEDKRSPGDHLFFRFEGDQFIRVYGRFANVVPKFG